MITENGEKKTERELRCDAMIKDVRDFWDENVCKFLKMLNVSQNAVK